MSFTLPNFSRTHLLVVGDVMLDRYWYGHVSRISPEAPVPVVNVESDKTSPGGAANVAVCLKDLGCQVSLYGVIGQEEAGDRLLNHLSQKGIQNQMYSDTHLKTVTKLRVIDETLHQQLIRLDFEPAPHQVLADSIIDQLIQNYCEQIKSGQVDAVVLSDYGKNSVLRDPQRFISPARAAGIPVFVDPKRVDLTAYRGATLLTPNTKEFFAAAGHCAEVSEFVERGLNIIKEHALEALLITRGAQGMMFLQPGEPPLNLGAHSREIFDVTGAGDMVVALLAAGRAAHLSWAEAVKLANLGAGLVVKKLGTASLSIAELQVGVKKMQGLLSQNLLAQSDLVALVKAAQSRGERVVFTNGCFDILHSGHVIYLEQAHALGDWLVVGMNDDASVARLKGAGRPVNSLVQRATVLSALNSVDWVVPFSEDTPLELIKAIAPDVLVKGGDYRLDSLVGADVVQSYGGTVQVLDYVGEGEVSTTQILKKMGGLSGAD